jgi:hypothetical protein
MLLINPSYSMKHPHVLRGTLGALLALVCISASATTVFAAPDIITQNITGSGSFTTGSTVTFSGNVTNTGTALTNFGGLSNSATSSAVVTPKVGTFSNVATAVVNDGSFIYVGGYDTQLAPHSWRIEMREITSGVFVAGLGVGGIVQSGTQDVFSMGSDANYLFVAGWSPASGRIEKRNKSDGALVAAFGTGGMVTRKLPGAISMMIFKIIVDGGNLYTVGCNITGGSGCGTNSSQVIEKFDATSGALIWSITSDPTTAMDQAGGIVADASYIYVSGTQGGVYTGTPPWSYANWRIEKRAKSDGSLVAAFGVGGVVTGTFLSAAESPVLATDGVSLYISGVEETDASCASTWYCWRIEKRNMSTGGLVSGFNGTGAVVVNDFISQPHATAYDGSENALYVLGHTAGSCFVGAYCMKIEKRDATSGALILPFGTYNDGLVISDPSGPNDIPQDVSFFGDTFFVAGYQLCRSGSDSCWRMEKRGKYNGGLYTNTIARFCIDNPSCATSTVGQIGNDIDAGLLGAGATIPLNRTWTATAGTHTVYFCGNVQGNTRTKEPHAVAESNAANNCTSSTFTVAPPPDIVAQNLTVTGSLTTGNTLTFSGNVTNAGGGMDTTNAYKLVKLGGTVSAVTSGSTLHDIAVSGNYAYGSVGGPQAQDLETFNVSNPVAPSSVGSLETGFNGNFEVLVQGSYAYMMKGDSGYALQIFSLSTPSSPVLVGQSAAVGGSSMLGMDIVGSYAYLTTNGSGPDGLEIFNISNPAAPFEAGAPGRPLSQGDYSNEVAVSGDYAYVAGQAADTTLGQGYIDVFNVANRAAPVWVRRIPTFAVAYVVSVNGAYLYTGGGMSGGVQIFSLANPSNPVLVAQVGTNLGEVRKIRFSGNYAYIAGFALVNQVQIVDISNPASPVLVGRTTTATQSWGVFPALTKVYTANDASVVGVHDLEIFEPHTFGRFCVDNASCLTSTTGRLGGKDFDAGRLGAAGTSATSTTWTATAGTHTIYYCSDVQDANNYDGVAESNEANNCTSTTFTVAPPPPTVTTQAATAVSVTGATLNGNGNPNGSAATGWFRYDTMSENLQCGRTDQQWNDIAYGNGLFVAVSYNCSTRKCVMTSSDGITWTPRTTPVGPTHWMGVTYGNGLFVAVASMLTLGNRVMTSPDGINWTLRTSAADNQWQSVTYGNGLFVAVADTGTGNRVMTSPDGITWTIRASAADKYWDSVTYGNGLFVAVDASLTAPSPLNQIMTSPDGINWTIHTSPVSSNKAWDSVTYGNGLFVAVADGVTGVMTSPDGITWTTRTSAANNGWRGVTYGNGLFVAVAETGTGDRIMTSPDGINWTIRTSAANNGWEAATYGNGLFVAVSDGGMINRVMTSPDGITWTSRVTGPADAGGTRAPASGGTALGSGSTGVAYSSAISGLSGGTTYYYCAIASNTGGTGFGAIVSFVTAPALPDLMISLNPSLNTGTLVAGNTVTFKGTIMNGGSVAVVGTYNNRFEIDIDNNGSVDVTLTPHPTLTNTAVNAGAVVTSGTWTNIPVGTHRVILCADNPTPVIADNKRITFCSRNGLIWWLTPLERPVTGP